MGVMNEWANDEDRQEIECALGETTNKRHRAELNEELNDINVDSYMTGDEVNRVDLQNQEKKMKSGSVSHNVSRRGSRGRRKS